MATIFKYVLQCGLGIFIFLALTACNQQAPENDTPDNPTESVILPDDANTADNSPEESSAQSSPELGTKIVNYAGTLAGVPYKEAGRDTTGFDCSGFVHYVFNQYDIEIPHSSRHIAQMGKEISIEEAKQGDLVFFRGTDPASTEVGHVGIVVSGTGEKIKFIHSSSARSSPCVRFDSLEKPNYQRRFLMIKRVI
jgi:cell wall-associated NlpC family hydrolase